VSNENQSRQIFTTVISINLAILKLRCNTGLQFRLSLQSTSKWCN